MVSIQLQTITDKNLIKVNYIDAKKIGFEKIKMTLIRFGYKVADVSIELDDSVSQGTIYISENIVSKLKLPITEDYLIKVNDNELILGPYIGIYTSPKEEITGWKVERLKSFVIRFKEEINGVMIAFTHEDINYEKLEVNAFYYDSKNDVWIRKVMPLPTVIHRYGDMNRAIRNKLRSIYGNLLFNYDELDKWSEISSLITNEKAKRYVSNTKLCDNIQTFKTFIENHNDFYFKPIKGRKGRGIHRVQRMQNGSYLLTVQAIKEYKKIEYSNVDELIENLREAIYSKEYILQRTINLSIDERVIDFRVRFEKNSENEWELSIFAARVSGKGGVVSNRSAGGEVIAPIEALRKYYQFDEKKAEFVRNELIEAGRIITTCVEEAHVNYLKCAVDLGVEPDGTIYHIETNVKAPNDLTTRAFEGYDGLDKACSLNSLYSKRMAGFKDVQNKMSFMSESMLKSYKNDKRRFKVTFGGSQRTQATIEMIKESFNINNVIIKEENIKKFHYQFIVIGTEEILVKVAKQIREKDYNNIVRSILIEQIKRNTTNKSKQKPSILKENQIEELKKENQLLKKELRELKNSRSWKVSKPIRLIGKVLKRK